MSKPSLLHAGFVHLTWDTPILETFGSIAYRVKGLLPCSIICFLLCTTSPIFCKNARKNLWTMWIVFTNPTLMTIMHGLKKYYTIHGIPSDPCQIHRLWQLRFLQNLSNAFRVAIFMDLNHWFCMDSNYSVYNLIPRLIYYWIQSHVYLFDSQKLINEIFYFIQSPQSPYFWNCSFPYVIWLYFLIF